MRRAPAFFALRLFLCGPRRPGLRASASIAATISDQSLTALERPAAITSVTRGVLCMPINLYQTLKVATSARRLLSRRPNRSGSRLRHGGEVAFVLRGPGAPPSRVVRSAHEPARQSLRQRQGRELHQRRSRPRRSTAAPTPTCKYPPAKPGALGFEPLKAVGRVADAAREVGAA